MTKGIFITGTDTGVGKTVIAAGLIRALARKGVKAGAMKPVETGCIDEGGTLIARDGMFLRKIAGMDEPAEIVAPVRFSSPLAPMVAAELEGRSVDLDAVMHAYSMLITKYDFLVVEGAGGLLVPLMREDGRMAEWMNGRTDGPEQRRVKATYFISNLIKSLDLPVVVVAKAGLGTINHTLLTVMHALGEGIEVRGVIINNCEPGDTVAGQTNPEVLQRICPVPILGVVPYYYPSPFRAACDVVDTVADALSDAAERLILSQAGNKS
jgi:dethiobiotin synthetase